MSDTTLTYAIDFGTTNSLLGAASSQQVYSPIPLDPFATDPTILRSLLYFPNSQHCFYGAQAVSSFVENEMTGRLFRSFKSHLRSRSYLGTVVDDRPMPLEQMVGIFLLEMKRRADQHFNQDVTRVVLGRPARYSMDIEEDKFAEYRMRKAAEFAGFREIEFLPEPVAAAYEFRRGLTAEKLVLVADLGGGTSDFSVVRLGAHAFRSEDVLSVGGVPVAGDALDSALMMGRLAPLFGSDVVYRVPMGSNFLTMPPSIMQNLTHPSFIVHLKERETYDFLKQMQGWSLNPTDRRKLERLFVLVDDHQIFQLFEKVEECKRDLSLTEQTHLTFAYPDIDLDVQVSRREFEDLARNRASKILAALDESLHQAGVDARDIDLVCCTGGTVRVPMIQRELEARFGPERMQTRSHFHSVVHGLCERAFEWMGARAPRQSS